jgi:hypothetical protein
MMLCIRQGRFSDGSKFALRTWWRIVTRSSWGIRKEFVVQEQWRVTELEWDKRLIGRNPQPKQIATQSTKKNQKWIKDHWSKARFLWETILSWSASVELLLKNYFGAERLDFCFMVEGKSCCSREWLVHIFEATWQNFPRKSWKKLQMM